MEIMVTSFYKYVPVENPRIFQKEWQEFCNNLCIRGKILVGEEGINGSMSGTRKQIGMFESKLRADPRFEDVDFKWNFTKKHPFRKTIVRVRKEIITTRWNVSQKDAGEYVTPEEFQEMIESEEDIIILDARNNYESKIGKFKGAVTPDIKTFREFSTIAETLDVPKDKKIVMYCTGGIRCEKASAIMKKNGFQNVCQLHGGILKYVEKFPDSNFQGRCFVFDDRLSIPSGPGNSVITYCKHCHATCGDPVNCSNTRCDAFFICCESCRNEWEQSCSKECMHSEKNALRA